MANKAMDVIPKTAKAAVVTENQVKFNYSPTFEPAVGVGMIVVVVPDQKFITVPTVIGKNEVNVQKVMVALFDGTTKKFIQSKLIGTAQLRNRTYGTDRNLKVGSRISDTTKKLIPAYVADVPVITKGYLDLVTKAIPKKADAFEVHVVEAQAFLAYDRVRMSTPRFVDNYFAFDDNGDTIMTLKPCTLYQRLDTVPEFDYASIPRMVI